MVLPLKHKKGKTKLKFLPKDGRQEMSRTILLKPNMKGWLGDCVGEGRKRGIFLLIFTEDALELGLKEWFQLRHLPVLESSL